VKETRLSKISIAYFLSYVESSPKTTSHQSLMAVISGNWEAEIGRIEVPGLPGKKVCETSSQPVSWVWWNEPVIPAIQAIDRRIKE
jgi:hypothetical protein